jgi:formamidopyrimidine-DNA glycosylase
MAPDRVLARGKFLSEIGNEYVDEILWAACVSAFHGHKDLNDEELRRA